MVTLKVLHLNSSDGSGGAAIAAQRLHQGLLAQGVESRFLVGTAQRESEQVATIPRRVWLENSIARVSWRLGLNDLHAVSSFAIPNHEFYQSADILNFHNLHGGYFNYRSLPHLTANKPAVYTLHDMWSFTGHCVYSFDCDRWKTGCGRCPYPNTYPAIQRDTSALEWWLKRRTYSKSNLVVVALSQWLMEQAQQSILGGLPIHYIPNGIDTAAYQPLDQAQCRAALGIPVGKNVLMFGAQSLSDPRKGGDLLFQALQSLPASLRAETVLLTIGSESIKSSESFGMTVYHFGYVSSDRLKTVLYSAADLFILPTRADNLPVVLQESMACGTPMVSFKIGGVPDLVRPGVTGYLAEPENAADLSRGISSLLEDHSLRLEMGRSCREIAVKEYAVELQAQRYRQLYQQRLSHSV